MSITNAYLRFINDDSSYFVSVFEYMESHPDQYQDTCDCILYRKVGENYEPV